jgi:haloalkane dehalogenase
VTEDLYPFESRFLVRHGFKIHYVDEGHGEPIVMVHGNPTWSFLFRDCIKTLRPNYRCVALDHLGCGKSDKPPIGEYPYRLINRVQDLEALMDSLGLDSQVTLMLHDWGGMIGMAAAVRRPERIARLILLNTAAFGLPEGKSLPRTLHWARNTALGRWAILHANAFCLAAARWCAVKKSLPKPVRDAYLAPYARADDRWAVLRFVLDIPLSPADPSFQLVMETARGLSNFAKTPTLIGWGQRDFVFDDDFLHEWKRRMPHAEIHAYPDAGHYVLEDAGDELIPRIAHFLNQNPVLKKPTRPS